MQNIEKLPIILWKFYGVHTYIYTTSIPLTVMLSSTLQDTGTHWNKGEHWHRRFTGYRNGTLG